MDSNKIQNEQTNTFSGGMNTDAADHVLGSDQYRSALNLRYVNNKESATGSLKVIDGFKSIYKTELGEDIIETTQVGQYGIFFTEDQMDDQNKSIRVYRFPLDKKTISRNDVKLIFGPCNDWNIYEDADKKIKNRLSIVGRQEGPDNIKLYIADGIHQILIMDVLSDTVPTSINDISTNSYESLMPPKISKLTYGSLKAGKNQYAFQFYSKYKQQTSMSPLSRLINIVNVIDNFYEFKGAKEGDFTNMGVELKIQIPKDSNYDLIKIYRIYYQQNSETPDIDLIFDGNFVSITEDDKKYLYHLDSSNDSISKISVNDFNSKSGLYMIPRVIESKDDYLFAAQIKEYKNTSKSFDDINTISISASPDGNVQFLNANDKYQGHVEFRTDYVKQDNWKVFDEETKQHDCWNPYTQNDDGINYNGRTAQYLYTFPEGPNRKQYYGGSGKNIDWRFITTILPADYSKSPNIVNGTVNPNIDYRNKNKHEIDNRKYYITKDGVLERASQFRTSNLNNNTYQNPIIASELLSLRRGETYRFGIIFTDKKGVSSPVKWITDITVPDIHIKGFQTFANGIRETELSVMPIGVEFKLHDIHNDDIYSYEIVRCNRSSNDIRVISQGVLSRPVIKKFMDDSVQKDQYYTPSGFLTTNRLNIDPPYNREQTSYTPVDTNYRINNFSNQNLFQFISPEFSYTNKSIIDFIDRSNIKLDILKYLFSLNSDNRTVDQSIDIRGSIYRQINNSKYESFNTTDFACNKGNELNTYDLYPFKLPVKNGNTLQFDTTNSLYKNVFLYNNLTMFNQINNIYGLSNATLDIANDLLMYNCTYSVTMSGDNIFQNKTYNDIEQAQRIKYQYFKLYCQSNSVLVYDNNQLDQNNPYTTTQNDKLTGYSIMQHNVKNQYGINSKQVSESLKWNDLFEVKNDKNEQKFSDKLNLVGEHGFCNVVCWGQYNEQPKSIKRNDIHLIDMAMYALGGTSLLFTIDGKLKEELRDNDKLLSETIGTNNILTMDEDAPNGTFTTNTSILPQGVQQYEYSYINANGRVMSEHYINASSFGTFLCNITRKCTPYGGYTKSAKDNSKYYSYSDIKEFNNNQDNYIDVFNGDTYIGPFEYTSAHKVSNRAIGLLTTMNVQYAIPVESSINMYIDNGYTFSRNINNDIKASWIQEEPSNVDGVFKQTIPQYMYNTAYSLTKTIGQKYSTISYDTKDKQYYPYRCRYSEKKENGELEDSWQNFKAANYIDVDPNYGKITGLKRFKNNLMFWQERSFGAFSVNERTAVTDNNNHEILLGSGGLLSRYDYVSTTSGLEDNVFAYAITTQSLYWIDLFNTVFCQYNGGGDYSQISITKNINTDVSREYSLDGNAKIKRYKVLTDPRYNEVYFTSEGGVFVFNELQQVFTSRYSYDGSCDSITGKYDTFIANNVGIRKNIVSLSGTNHMHDEVTISFNLTCVVNAQPNFVKVFDNVRFGATEGMAKRFNVSYTVNDGKELQCSTYIVNPSKDISNRYYDYRYAVPRMKYPYDLIQQYGSRLRGKAVYCNIGGEASFDDMQLHYITTKFRTLWS